MTLAGPGSSGSPDRATQVMAASITSASVKGAISSGSRAMTASWIGFVRVTDPLVSELEVMGISRVVTGDAGAPFCTRTRTWACFVLGHHAGLDAQGAKRPAPPLEHPLHVHGLARDQVEPVADPQHGDPLDPGDLHRDGACPGDARHQPGPGSLGQEVMLGERIARGLLVVEHAAGDLSEVGDHLHLLDHRRGRIQVFREPLVGNEQVIAR